MSNNSIWPIDRTLPGATNLSQSGPESNCNEGVVHIPQSSKTGASPSDCLMSYPGQLLKGAGAYSSAEMQLVYSTTVLQIILLKLGKLCVYRNIFLFPIFRSVKINKRIVCFATLCFPQNGDIFKVNRNFTLNKEGIRHFLTKEIN